MVFNKEFGPVGAVKPIPAWHLIEPVRKDGGPVLEEVIVLVLVVPVGRPECIGVELNIEVMSECEGEELKRWRGQGGTPVGVWDPRSHIQLF